MVTNVIKVTSVITIGHKSNNIINQKIKSSSIVIRLKKLLFSTNSPFHVYFFVAYCLKRRMLLCSPSEWVSEWVSERAHNKLCWLQAIDIAFPISMQATQMAIAVREMSICSKLGPNLSEMEFRIFVRIQKVIGFICWLLRLKLSRSKLFITWTWQRPQIE